MTLRRVTLTLPLVVASAELPSPLTDCGHSRARLCRKLWPSSSCLCGKMGDILSLSVLSFSHPRPGARDLTGLCHSFAHPDHCWKSL